MDTWGRYFGFSAVTKRGSKTSSPRHPCVLTLLSLYAVAIACAVLASIPRWQTQSRKIEAYPALQIHDPMPPRPCVFFQRTPSVSQVVYPMYTVLQHHLADGRASTKFRVREATAESVSIAKTNFVLAEDCLLHSPPRPELLSDLWHTVLPCRLHAFRGFTTNKRVRVTSSLRLAHASPFVAAPCQTC